MCSPTMLTIGLEPITTREQILSLSCLPISPSEPFNKKIKNRAVCKYYKYTTWTFVYLFFYSFSYLFFYAKMSIYSDLLKKCVKPPIYHILV